MGEWFFLVAVVVTLVHVVMDIILAIKHATHPADGALTFISIGALLGHMVLTGELSEWVGRLT